MKKYEVVIIGAGIVGASTLYILRKYTNINKIAIIEKYSKAAQVNSNRKNNSQTLHFGDIETNYTIEKAREVKEAASMTATYINKYAKNSFRKFPKMVIGIGDAEIKELEKRHEEFKELFPKLKKLQKKEIEKIEPKVIDGRPKEEKILALYSEDGYSVDFGKLSESFIQHAIKIKNADILFNTEVIEIIKDKKNYNIKTNNGYLQAKVVIVAAGWQALTFAYSLGYGKNYILLPVAGSFFCTTKALNGKVYTMQLKKLPFAAIHGDPDVENPNETRFGPTAKVLPMLERYNYNSVIDFFKLFEFRIDAILTIIKILSDRTIFKYIIKNFIYDIKFIGRIAFTKEIRKIIPKIKVSSVRYGKGIGGIRPQLVDVKERKLIFGEAKIIGDNIIFDISPSPGASVCLSNAVNNVNKTIEFLGKKYNFDYVTLKKDLIQP